METNESNNSDYKPTLVAYDAGLSYPNRTYHHQAIEKTLTIRKRDIKGRGSHCTINYATVLLIDNNGKIVSSGTNCSSSANLHAEINALYDATSISKTQKLSDLAPQVISYLKNKHVKMIVFTERAPCVTTNPPGRDISCHEFFQKVSRETSSTLDVFYVIPILHPESSHSENATLGLLLPAAFDTLNKNSNKAPSKLKNCINSAMTFKPINGAGSAPQELIFCENPLKYATDYKLEPLRYQKPDNLIKLPISFDKNVDFSEKSLFLNVETLISEYKVDTKLAQSRKQQSNNNNNVSSTTTTTTTSISLTQKTPQSNLQGSWAYGPPKTLALSQTGIRAANAQILTPGTNQSSTSSIQLQPGPTILLQQQQPQTSVTQAPSSTSTVPQQSQQNQLSSSGAMKDTNTPFNPSKKK